MWGATLVERFIYPKIDCFNSRTPCGVRRNTFFSLITFSRFNSRTPCGVRPMYYSSNNNHYIVSIHAPRVGCDYLLIMLVSLLIGFNSRTPCGVRLISTSISPSIIKFQFTHPVWGATAIVAGSIIYHLSFNSRTPCGVRLPTYAGIYEVERFNSRTPCGVRLRPVRLQ